MGENIILVVDDSKEIRDSLSDILRDEGYAVLEADNGMKAISICRQNDIKIVLLDISMPSLDGITVLKEIKKIKKDIRVIIISSYSNYVAEALREGAESFIEKPVSINEVLNAVKGNVLKN